MSLARPKELLEMIDGVPVMMMIPELDDLSPPEEQREAFEKLQPKKRMYWAPAGDIDNVSLDAFIFAFGERFGRSRSATRPAIDAVRALDRAGSTSHIVSGSMDDPVTFPHGKVDELLHATLELVETVQEVQGSPMPDLKWAYINSKPRVRRVTKLKEDYVRAKKRNAIGRLGGKEEDFVKSTVDHMVFREKTPADNDGRAPDFFSHVMIDEIFGFVLAGNNLGLKIPSRKPSSPEKTAKGS
ncbi:hypothetical protein GGS24DRAFT_512445 [Hypoxylon argillaceum]|nr:hypothetical protein GGS24DRAFT_512445 [Hypoxylon argillaceum]